MKRNPQQKCTHCRMRKVIVFEREYSFAVASGLVAPPEIYNIRLCVPCIVEFARTQIMEININQVRQLAGKGRWPRV